jgi:hypothetical protein
LLDRTIMSGGAVFVGLGVFGRLADRRPRHSMYQKGSETYL